MCRFVAYLGPPVTLEQLVVAPPHSLLRQSWDPRFQTSGSVNADGFGVGWYDTRKRPEPAVYRTSAPIWSDRSFLSFAGLVSSCTVVAAVRSATPPIVAQETNVAPFSNGRYLFVHNGAIEAFRDGVSSQLRRTLSEPRDSEVLGTTDSEVLFALALDRLDAGASLADALIDVARTVLAISNARLNLVLTDGERLVALCFGHSLFVNAGSEGKLLASEPFDDRDGWQQLAHSSLVDISPENLSVRAMPVRARKEGS